MNTQIRKLAVGLLVLYLALFVQLNVLQVGKQEALTADPQNNRQTIRDFNRPRGADRHRRRRGGGAQRAHRSGGAEFKYQREYPTGDLFGNITGYYTFSFGSTQLEKTQNDVLMGDTTQQTGRRRVRRRRQHRQRAAHAARRRATGGRATHSAGREGSVVVMDPNTGAVLAMVQLPALRPQPGGHARHRGRPSDVLDFLNNYPGKPLLANAYQERYMPGSSFKVITTGIALENGVTSARPHVRRRDRVGAAADHRPHPELRRQQSCGGTMVEVFYRSCNIPFAQMAVELGPERMIAGIAGVGHRRAAADRPARRRGEQLLRQRRASDFFENQLPLLAIGGFGQGNDLMVPLHMAMVASTVANGGRDDGAVRRRRHAAATTARCSSAPTPRCGRRRSRPTTAATLNDADGRASSTRAPAGRCSWPTASRPRPRPAPPS